jgi:hypothetical protein
MFDINRAPILHQELHYLQTDRTELLVEPRHLGVPSSASKTISMPMICSLETVHLSCTDTNIVSKRTKMRFHTTYVTYEFHRVRPKLFMSLWYVQYKPCTYLASRLAVSPMDRTELHQTFISTDANNVSKQIETRFHMTHITKEFHRVPQIMFLSLRYVQRKTCNNLASRVAISPNGPNQAST